MIIDEMKILEKTLKVLPALKRSKSIRLVKSKFVIDKYIPYILLTYSKLINYL